MVSVRVQDRFATSEFNSIQSLIRRIFLKESEAKYFEDIVNESEMPYVKIIVKKKEGKIHGHQQKRRATEYLLGGETVEQVNFDS